MKQYIVPILFALSLAGCKPQDPAPLPPEVNAPAPSVAATPPAADPAIATSDDSAADSAVAPAADAATTDVAVAVADGEAVFKKACTACHGAGIAGAPKVGDAADWGPRVAQGDALLLEHAIKGFTGKKGMMPPKGGFLTLSDDEVKAAIDYMVSHSK
ncbi:MAG: cytochrome c5 family protein [Rhodanobacteraceae bacterium]|nr:cytochrome c5 family protein [Rhodanobacteraceae bacterium]MBK7043534.1 cytochrome c5 family protein [Rhodanobacteraceae bacterium]MBP9153895.1 cytochrome c5 family protein [Xanthomonadales bacterium]HQW81135.1 c-type cytochrome [Pseudomonadota bacterium]